MMPDKGKQHPNSFFEATLHHHGIEPIAGLDEAGRGAWAGPVIAAAVVLPPPGSALDKQLHGIHDSKRLTSKRRDHWDRQVRMLALSVSVGEATVDEIDRIGILASTRLAMRRAVYGLAVEANHLLIDYILIGDVGIDQTAIPRGDSLALSIAAASVVAKVARDQLMTSYDREYPSFGFSRHKGYGTRQHQSALSRMGPCPIHRRSFAPIQRALERK